MTDSARRLNRIFIDICKGALYTKVDPTDINFIGSETLGEVLEKLQILNTRVWSLNDAAGEALLKGDKEEYTRLQQKIDICFKVKRPKLLTAVNLMIKDLMKGNMSHVTDDNVKIYKGYDE